MADRVSAESQGQAEAAAAEKEAGEGEELGRGEGFEPKAEEAKEGVECPATFGPIITDTAVPIDKGKFSIQPYFGLGFVTERFQPQLEGGISQRKF